MSRIRTSTTLSSLQGTLTKAFTAAFPGTTPAIIDRGPAAAVWVAARPNDSPIMNVAVPQLEAHLAFHLTVPGGTAYRHDVIGLPLPPWALYTGAVGWAWANRGYDVPGLDAVIMMDGGIQEGFVWETGLAFAVAWQELGGYPQPKAGLLELMATLGGYFHA